MPPRWQRCLQLLDRDIGDDVGRLFVERHFSDAARVHAANTVDRLLAALRADIASSDWLSAETRDRAMAKLSNILVVLGRSNRARTYTGLVVDRADAAGNAWRAQAMEAARSFALLAESPDRQLFFRALPQQFDAFGSKEMNATGFTAGFLQPPIFDPRMDDAVNFGGFGAVVGHELTHRFDDEGRKYDPDGNMRSWWSPEEVAKFQERAQCFVDEYSGFRTERGIPLDGKLTLGENIADNGGLRLSYAALRPSEVGPKIEGFTPAQRFFLAWGQIRCENVTAERERQRALSDVHAAGRGRVNGVVSNMPEFARAFSCSQGAPMAAVKRCKIW